MDKDGWSDDGSEEEMEGSGGAKEWAAMSDISGSDAHDDDDVETNVRAPLVVSTAHKTRSSSPKKKQVIPMQMNMPWEEEEEPSILFPSLRDGARLLLDVRYGTRGGGYFGPKPFRANRSTGWRGVLYSHEPFRPGPFEEVVPFRNNLPRTTNFFDQVFVCMSHHITFRCTLNNFFPKKLHWLLISWSLHITLCCGTIFWCGMLWYMLLILEVFS